MRKSIDKLILAYSSLRDMKLIGKLGLATCYRVFNDVASITFEKVSIFN